MVYDDHGSENHDGDRVYHGPAILLAFVLLILHGESSENCIYAKWVPSPKKLPCKKFTSSTYRFNLVILDPRVQKCIGLA